MGIGRTLGVVGQRFDDAAVADLAPGALLEHALELALEHGRPGESPLDLLGLPPRKPIHGIAWLVRAIREAEQLADM